MDLLFGISRRHSSLRANRVRGEVAFGVEHVFGHLPSGRTRRMVYTTVNEPDHDERFPDSFVIRVRDHHGSRFRTFVVPYWLR